MTATFENDPRIPIGIALLRLSLGAMFVAHGLLKVLVFTLPGTAQFFAAHGFPAWTAYPVAFGELAAGALLIAGWRTRVVALAMLPVLLGAAWVHLPNGWVFSAPNGGWEYPVYLSVLAAAQSLLGAGAWAIDGRRAPQTAEHRGTPALAG